MTHRSDMKKRMWALPLSLLLSLSLVTGCSKQKVNTRTNGTTGVADLLQSAQDASDAEKTSAPSSIEPVPSETPSSDITTTEASKTATSDPASSSASSDGIDIDLSIMSSNTVYAEVLGMVYEPERYKGKTVKMKGTFAVFHDESTDKYYFACIIKDATACCAQGIEFELKGDPKYPDGYPEEGAEITVTGAFDTYEEGTALYLVLRDAELT